MELYDLGDVWIGDVNMGIVGIQIAFVLVWVPLEADPDKNLSASSLFEWRVQELPVDEK